MRLAYLTSQFPFAYLGETFFRPELSVLLGLCEEIHVIPARPQLRRSAFEELRTVDVRIAPIELRTFVAALIETLQHPFRAALAFFRIAWPKYSLRAKLKNIVLFPKALAVARYARRHRIEHLHAHWLTTSSTIAYIVTIMTDIPWSCTAHAHDVYSDNLLSKASTADFVRVISARNCQSFNDFTAYRYAHRVHVGHLGVEVPATEAPQASGGHGLRIISPARLHPMKGHVYLLDALATLRNAGVPFHCDLAGDGELRDEITARITQLALTSHVTLRGMVEHRTLLAELQGGTYDVVVLSSVEEPALKEFFEGIPVALMEAMAAGIPCVSTRTGSIPELIDDTTGILVEQHDSRSLADAILRLATNPSLRRDLGRAARARIINDFNVEKTARALYELISAGMEREDSGGQSMPRGVSSPASMPAANAN